MMMIYLLFIKVNPNANCCPNFNLNSVFAFTVLPLFEISNCRNLIFFLKKKTNHSYYLLFMKVNPNANCCPNFNLNSVLAFTVLPLFEISNCRNLLFKKKKQITPINKLFLFWLQDKNRIVPNLVISFVYDDDICNDFQWVWVFSFSTMFWYVALFYKLQILLMEMWTWGYAGMFVYFTFIM
jgi:hypothetical protein